jgi:hypothetical protein
MFKIFKAITHSYLYMHDDVSTHGNKLYGLPVRVSFSYASNELLDVTTPVKRTSTAVKAFYDELDAAATIADVVGGSGVYDLFITTDPLTYMPKDATMAAPKVYHRWCHDGIDAADVHARDMRERAEYVRYYLDRAFPGSILRIWMNGSLINQV